MLSEDAVAMLAFERQWFARAGAREQAIRDRFGLSAITYAQWLNRLLDDRAALAADPVTVNRLRRIRDARASRVATVSPPCRHRTTPQRVPAGETGGRYRD